MEELGGVGGGVVKGGGLGFVELGEDLEFRGVGLAGGGEVEGVFDSLLGGGSGVFERDCCEGTGGFDERGVIQESEGGEGCIGVGALGGAFFAGGCVEGFEHGVEELALPVDVEAAPPLAGICMVGVGAGGEVEVLVIAGGLVGFDAGAADLVDEEAADGECGIADHFCGETPAGLAGEEDVGGIDFFELGGGCGALAVGLGGGDEFEDGFGIPAGLDELDGEVIEEFGVGGW
ncbi:MAG: hypothetical protein RI897_3892 [Verrucomicrobiota bacterium]